MMTARNSIRQSIYTSVVTLAIAIGSLGFQATSIASPDAEALSTEERASLERQLAIAREERDALVLETETNITELNETLDSVRAELTALRDQLKAAESAEADAKAQIVELTETLEAERAETAALRDQLEAAETAEADAKAQIVELTETLETKRSALEEQRDEHAATKTAKSKEREQLEQQLAIAREERDALVLETEARIAELSATLDAERAQRATLSDALEAAESALTDAKANAEQPVSGLGVSQADATDLGGQLTEKGILIEFTPDELRFESASADLPTTDLPTLDRIVERLENRPGLSVLIQGHTDSLGNPEINQTLSQQRAEAVRQGLIERGLDAERVAAEGAGSTRPIADNATPEGQRQNRRVEIYLLAAQEDDNSTASNAEQ